ncbi:MAG TPA: helix-turn-helix domain-containing protein, partial [Anaerolineae bacterium]
MPHKDMPFGDWLRQRRKRLDLTQADLARLVSCSVSAIRKIESSERRPSPQLTLLLADTLKIPPNQRDAFLSAARAMIFNGSEEVPDDVDFDTNNDRAISAGLPIPETEFVGREFECEKLKKLLCSPACRLITLTGPGGIGKTRLAIHVAADLRDIFPDGVYFIPLASVAAAEHIPKAIAGVMGLTEYDDSYPVRLIFNYLHDRHILLVFDNMEQMLAQPATVGGETPLSTGSDVLLEILKHAPGVKIL